MNRYVLAAILAFNLAFTLSAANKIGDPAPALVITDWLKGSAVQVDDSKKTLVVEFWATWCGPCIQLAPHVSGLQTKYKSKGVVFVGVTWEEKDVVKKFLKEMGNKINYTIALDKDEQTKAKYLEAFGLPGIPHSFIIKNGKILWYGHPLEVENILLQVVNGTFDLAAAIKADELNTLANTFLKPSINGDPEAKALGAKLIDQLGDRPKVLASLAFETVADPRFPHRNFAFANDALTAAEKNPGADLHFIKAVRAVVLFESGKTDEGLVKIDEALSLAQDAPDIAQYKQFKQVMKARLEEVQKQQAETPAVPESK